MGIHRPASLASISRKLMEQLILGTISKHIEDKKMIVSSQDGFIKGKSRLINLVALYNEMSIFVDDGRAMNVVYLDISNTFNAVSHDVLTDNLIWYRLNK